MADSSFLLGVGAQKSGTTWVNRYILGQPAGFTQTYEYHVWDALYLPLCAGYVAERPGFAQELNALARRLRGKDPRKEVLRYRMQQDPTRYFDHFAQKLARPGCTLAADITPSYAGLPEEALARIRDGFAARGIPVKVLFIMRDPVERCWSAVRMKKEKRNLDPGLGDEDVLRMYFDADETRMRTDYHKTMARLDAVFAPGQIHYAFSETLFTRAEMDRISAFLGLPPDYSRLSQKENHRAKTGAISDALRAEVATAYAEVYRACAARFDGIGKIWPNARFVLD